ncbi:mannose-1-phosphate guanylyltransferase / phosphomannomutase [Caldanaerobius fijiensis DSM 17918]|uniref:Mannose-1-phosphate guanylyltransferase / phosphomannomutase n=1 Tax=Caldanaerobius fijiensis DSM 17918 TaxID=1121256 RepID=A0A1M4VH50_9THEO|nr:sugar phosphate nucleotidyltransferase [Caldanaerobius fijiensis]SHE68374.1 mannose-1-phosphate guanylyltransferase / phosphomannomutase [Caldanaerobius fijiensis DSM 17918]
MKAVVMAGGIGSRLKPLTCNIPKPLVPVANRPVMEYTVELLKKYGITDICATLQYLPNTIKEHFGDGKCFGVNMRYYIEDEPLGTAGSVKNAEDFLDEPFIVISGDVLTDFRLDKALEFHRSKGALVTIVLTRVAVPLEYGVVITDDTGKIIRFLEKPSWSEVFSDTVNTGIYILQPEVLDYIKKGQVFDFSKDFFPMLLRENKPIYGYIAEGYWCDIGNIQEYMNCHRDILNGRIRVNLREKPFKPNIWMGNNVKIGENTSISDYVIIGDNVRIGKNVFIDSGTVIGDDVVIEDNATIKRSIIWKNSYVGKNSEIRAAVVCHRVQLKNRVCIFENSVIGDDTLIKEGSIIKPDVKIWPQKMIDAESIVSSDVIWGTRYKKNIFGYDGASGHVNVDMTPEFCARLGAVIPCIIKGKIGVSCDDSVQSKMLKMALISGLMSAGAHIYDFGTLILPMARAAVKDYRLGGSVHVKRIEDSEVSVINILDSKGCNIDKGMERKLENVLSQGDFKRCIVGEITDVEMIPDYDKVYMIKLLNNIDTYSLRKRHFTVSFNTPSDYMKRILNTILNYCGCKIQAIGEIDFYIDNNGETLGLKGPGGKIIPEETMIALRSYLMIQSDSPEPVVIPINSPDAISDMVKAGNKQVIYTKTALQERMGKIAESTGNSGGITQFDLNFDAISFLVKILEILAKEKITLEELLNRLPNFYYDKEIVPCSWDAKGRIIRSLIEEANKDDEVLEGAKIKHDKGWAMVLPDPEQPACRVYAQGYTEEYARELTDMYVKKIKSIDGK